MSDFYKAFICILISGIFLILLSSCSKFDKEEPIPSYITIEKIELLVPDSLKDKQGSASSNISDAWIYLDDKLQGIYELPAKFPVLKEGTLNLRIRAGIKENGIGSTRPVYPFYTAYTGTITLEKEKITAARASVYYQSYTKFDWKENFEGSAISLTATANNDSAFSLVANAFEGTKSLAGFLDAGHPVFEYTSSVGYNLPTNGTNVFLELNYKTNCPLQIGFIANTQGVLATEPILALNASTNDNNVPEWRKVYVDLTFYLEAYPNADNFKILFRVDKPEELGLAEFYMDNIKLVE